MSIKKSDLKAMVKKIETVARKRMLDQKIVSLEQLRTVQKKIQTKTVLLIDDDQTLRKSLVRAFKNEGFDTVAIEDGTKISEILDEVRNIDLILLDVGLPWIDGIELAALLKESSALRDTPMVFMSGRTEMEDIKIGFKAGADDYIKKPFDLKRLIKTVKTLIQLREV
jgi:two-component system aerobic respiration control protein ArcA